MIVPEPQKRFLEKLQCQVTSQAHGRIFCCELARCASPAKRSCCPSSHEHTFPWRSGDDALLITCEFLGLMGHSHSRQIEGAWTGGGIDHCTTVNERPEKPQPCHALFRKWVQICRLPSFMSSENTNIWSEARLEDLNTAQRAPPAAPTRTYEAPRPERPTRKAEIEALEGSNKQALSRQSPQTPLRFVGQKKNSTSAHARPQEQHMPRRVPDAEWKAMSKHGPTRQKCESQLWLSAQVLGVRWRPSLGRQTRKATQA